MADPKTIRINNADDPDRLATFEAALKRSGQNASEVIRHMADAYIRFVNQHGHGPTFPVQMLPFAALRVAPRRKGKR